jgi:predicted Zn-dependent peptidase
MSSPLMDAIRERRPLVYYAACSADVMALCGQFVIEASTGPEHVDALFGEVARLLIEHTERIDRVALERARNQLAVRSVRAHERPTQRLENAAQDLFLWGRVRPRAELTARFQSVTPAQLRAAFRRMLDAGPSVAVAGRVGKAAPERFMELLAGR